MIDIKYYPQIWYKIEFDVSDDDDNSAINFKCFEIRQMGFDENDISQYEFDSTPNTEGFIKWDGCCEINSNVHFCGFHNVEQYYSMIKEVYLYAESKGFGSVNIFINKK